MTKQLLILTFSALVSATIGQVKFEPQILILTPNEVAYGKEFEKEISKTNKNIKRNSDSKKQSDYLESKEFAKKPENIQLMKKSEVAFLQKLDVFKNVSYISEQYLTYRFYERFPQVLVLLSDDKSQGDVASLASHSKSQNLQYVLNFSKIELMKKSEESFAKLSIQLYDNISNSILLNKTYEGDWISRGFEFACEDSTINCAINNALSKALGEVIYLVASNNPTLKNQKQLSRERFDILSKKYLDLPFDKTFLNNIIPKADSSINTSILFQCLQSDDKTEFIGFFIDQISKQNFKNLADSKKDRSINIISGKDVNSDGFLDDVPQTYAYIVNGVLYKGKWYYEKEKITYFEAKDVRDGEEKYFNNLQKWHFFKENSVEIDPNFWHTHFFSKIESAVEKNTSKIEELKLSLSQTKNKEEREAYQSMIDDYYEKDLKNQGYLGLYDIVADQLKKEKRKQNELLVNQIKNNFLNDFYESMNNKSHIKQIVKMNGNDYPLIFPSDKRIFLSPIALDYGNENLELIYFVLIPNSKSSYDIYQWTYFKPIKPQYKSMYGQEVNKQLNQVTRWNFSFDTLDDNDFWDKYVLVKEEEKYKYLKTVQ